MAFCDFRVKYNPKKETLQDLTEKILYSVIIKPIKANKPRVMFIGGESGEGKSLTALKLQEILLKIQGHKLTDYINDINIYTPLEYPEKIQNLLFNKKLKKINIVCMHEAREIVKAKLWHGFLAQATADINAMSRTVKRLCTIIISQFIRDITADTRYTLTFYCIVRRPIGKHARLYINVIWKDDRDLEKPKLRRRKLSGYLVDEKGRHRRFIPQYLELTKPSKEIIEIFEKNDYEAKAMIIKNKVAKLIKEMKQDIGEDSKKISSMVEWYLKRADDLTLIGRQRRGKWVINKDFKSMHELNENEAVQFEKKLNEKLQEKGIIEAKAALLGMRKPTQE